MNFSLSVFERIILLNILPQNVDMTMYGIYHEFLQDLSFNKFEYNEFEISFDKENKVHWKDNKSKNISINNNIINIIKDILKSCNKKELLQEEHMELYNKFVTED